MSSPNIAFNSIPSSIRKPGKYFEFNSSLAVNTLPSNAQRLLILAQKTTAGAATALTPLQVYSDAEAIAAFGRGSHAHLMVRAAIRAYPYARITVLPVEDSGDSTAATSRVTVKGAATGSGRIVFRVADQAAAIAVDLGTTASQVAADLVLEISRQIDWPVVAAVTEGEDSFTITARNKGALGNDLVVSFDATVDGITVTTTAMAGGAGEPELAEVLAPIAGASEEILVCPWTSKTALQALREHLSWRGNAIELRGGVGVYAITSGLATAVTTASAINGERLTGALLPGTTTPPWIVAAVYAAVVSSEEDPARPLNTLPLLGVEPPPLAVRLTRTEQEACLANGVTPLEVGPGETVQIVRAITTYTTSPEGVPDIAWLDLTTIRTMDYVRTAVRSRMTLRFPREKLSQRTPPRVRSEILDVLRKLEDLEIVENVEANKDALLVERDSQDPNRLNARIPTDVVNGLHVLAGRLDLIL